MIKYQSAPSKISVGLHIWRWHVPLHTSNPCSLADLEPSVDQWITTSTTNQTEQLYADSSNSAAMSVASRLAPTLFIRVCERYSIFQDLAASMQRRRLEPHRYQYSRGRCTARVDHGLKPHRPDVRSPATATRYPSRLSDRYNMFHEADAAEALFDQHWGDDGSTYDKALDDPPDASSFQRSRLPFRPGRRVAS